MYFILFIICMGLSLLFEKCERKSITKDATKVSEDAKERLDRIMNMDTSKLK